MTVDPIQKAGYQVGLSANGVQLAAAAETLFTVRGIDFPTSTNPTIVAYDAVCQLVYWHDDGPVLGSIKYKHISNLYDHEHLLATFDNGKSALIFSTRSPSPVGNSTVAKKARDSNAAKRIL